MPRLRDALAAVALDAQRALPARVLSQGQRRRIGLARLSLLARGRCGCSTSRRPRSTRPGSRLLAQLIAQQLAARRRAWSRRRTSRSTCRPNASRTLALS